MCNSNNKQIFGYEYDMNGNIFIVVPDVEDKNENYYYILGVDKNDDICFDRIFNKIYGPDEHIKIINSVKQDIHNKLHIKSMEEVVNEIDKNLDLEDFTQDELQDISDVYNEIRINPEYKSYKNADIIYDDDEYSIDDSNKFEIFSSPEKIVKPSKLLYEPPCFETIIYHNGVIVMRTQIMNNQPFYRISIYLVSSMGKTITENVSSDINMIDNNSNDVTICGNNTMQLNIIGTKIKYYHLLSPVNINKIDETPITLM